MGALDFIISVNMYNNKSDLQHGVFSVSANKYGECVVTTNETFYCAGKDFIKNINREASYQGLPDSFKRMYMGEFVQESEESKRAFDALMEYEKIMINIYDRPMMHSLPPRKGHRMPDIALKHGTTVEEMEKQRNAVEQQLKRDGYDDSNNKRS